MKKYLWLAVVGLSMISCKQRSNDYKAVFSDPLLFCRTVKKLNDVVMENNFPPIIASRNYTYATIAAYECVAAGNNNYQSLAGQIKQLPVMPKPDTSNGKKIDFHLAALF